MCSRIRNRLGCPGRRELSDEQLDVALQGLVRLWESDGRGLAGGVSHWSRGDRHDSGHSGPEGRQAA